MSHEHNHLVGGLKLRMTTSIQWDLIEGETWVWQWKFLFQINNIHELLFLFLEANRKHKIHEKITK